MTRVREPDYGSWVGLFPGFSLLCVCGTVSETVTVIAGFDDVAMLGEAVEQRGGHRRVVEDPGPFTEGKVGSEDPAGARVEFAQQVEQPGAVGLRERQIAELIENDPVDLQEPVGDLPRLAVGFLLFERVDAFDSGEEPDSEAMVRDCLTPMTTQSSLQSNWNASPGANTSGTNLSRLTVEASCCWRRHTRANAATRS